MPVELTDDDAGKAVLDGDGNHVGYVDEVEDGTAHVDPDADVDEQLWTKLDGARPAGPPTRSATTPSTRRSGSGRSTPDGSNFATGSRASPSHSAKRQSVPPP